MAEVTQTDYCDSSLSLMMGCLDGCDLWDPVNHIRTCYAGQLVERYGDSNKGFPESFDKPQIFRERLDHAARWTDLSGVERPTKPWLNHLPRVVELNNTGDTFTNGLPLAWLKPFAKIMEELPFIFIVSTKRAVRMVEYSKTSAFPDNFWLFVSITSSLDYDRLDRLMEARGSGLRGVSYSAPRGPVDLSPWLPRIGWVIASGATGPHATPAHPDWFRAVRDQCVKAGTPFFFRGFGEYGPATDRRGDVEYVLPVGGLIRPGASPEILGLGARMVKLGSASVDYLLDGAEWREVPGQGVA